MLLALNEQPGPNVELEFIGGAVPFEAARWKYDAMTVGEGYDTRFYECPVREPVGVVCVDGVWHWRIEA